MFIAFYGHAGALQRSAMFLVSTVHIPLPTERGSIEAPRL